MEQTSGSPTGTGFVIDGDKVGKPQGITVGGSINNFAVGVDLENQAFSNDITANITSTTTTLKVGTTAISTTLPSTLILTNSNYATGSVSGGTAIATGSQIPTDLTFSPESTPAAPGGSGLVTNARRVYSNSGSTGDVTVEKPDMSTVDLETHGVTALGDILFANSTPVLVALAGNNTSNKEYLRSTGSSGLATAPTSCGLRGLDGLRRL